MFKKKNIRVVDHMQFQEDNVESLMTNIILHGMQITIVNVYATPYATLPNILDILEKTFSNISISKPIIILGDFNVKMHEHNTRTKTVKYYMHSHNLHFLLDTNTYMHTSLIDHVWSNITNNYKIYKLDTYWLDHDTICPIMDHVHADESQNTSNSFHICN